MAAVPACKGHDGIDHVWAALGCAAFCLFRWILMLLFIVVGLDLTPQWSVKASQQKGNGRCFSLHNAIVVDSSE
ncbi:hypothetical protein VFPPC_15225 [Pochonia chlamydosporia 170]|uniref:Uncharacterized protein n=1 Tax=Pochonia chlamydosporia 170 TaxID=1380566 RepID=A0A179G548_METCM|nr:hypothetical protein VFPPC_15225 [Pochonia chlamydosporia 170]OAQ72957.1 hypothetical protein VFPPC_15225 [Pochonia chlamydosporia 170]